MRDESLGRLRELEEETDWAAEQALRQRLYPRDILCETWRSALPEVSGSWDWQMPETFYQRYYRPQHLIVSIAGDIAPEEALAAGEKAFGTWKGEAESSVLFCDSNDAQPEKSGTFVSKTRRSALVLAGLASLSRFNRTIIPF